MFTSYLTNNIIRTKFETNEAIEITAVSCSIVQLQLRRLKYLLDIAIAATFRIEPWPSFVTTVIRIVWLKSLLSISSKSSKQHVFKFGNRIIKTVLLLNQDNLYHHPYHIQITIPITIQITIHITICICISIARNYLLDIAISIAVRINISVRAAFITTSRLQDRVLNSRLNQQKSTFSQAGLSVPPFISPSASPSPLQAITLWT